MKNSILFFLVSCLISYTVVSQHLNSDSLKIILEKPETNDTTKLAILDILTSSDADLNMVEVFSKQMLKICENTSIDKLAPQDGKKYKYYYGIAKNNLGFVAENKGRLPEAEELYREALELLKIAGNRNGLIVVYNNLGYFYKVKGKMSLSLELYNQSLVQAKELNDYGQIARAMNNIGRVYQTVGKLSEALSYFREANLSYRKINNPNGEYITLNNISGVYFELGETETYLKYQKEAVEKAKKTSNPARISASLERVAFTYRTNGNFEEALINYKQAFELAEKVGNKRLIGQIVEGIGVTYEKQNEYDKSLQYLLQALKLSEELGAEERISSVLESIGVVYEKKKEFLKAQNYFEKSFAAAQKTLNLNVLMNSSAGLSRVYKATNKPAKALKMYEFNIRIRDSINNDNARKTALKSQYKFEFEVKAKQDSMQSAQEKKILTAQLKQEKSQRYLWASAGLLLFSSIGFTFYRYRLKQKIKELSLRNRIASDLHDEVGSAISSISIIAGMAKRKPELEMNNIINQIENTSRETIDNMADIVWSIEPTNDDIHQVIQRMEQFGNNILTPAGIEFVFNYSNDIKKIKLDLVQRKNLYLIYKEGINNAAKYSQAQQVTVEIVKTANELMMQIRDNGRGFETSHAMVGNGLNNMRRRAEEIGAVFQLTSKEGNGTTLLIKFKL